MTLVGILGILAALFGPGWMFLVILLAAAVWYAFNFKRKDLIKKAEIVNQPIILHSFPTEFSFVLRDNSTITVTVYFSLPSTQQLFIEQLNHETSKILLRYGAHFTDPPSTTAVDDHLQTALARFQNENAIPVLRAELTSYIHTPVPPKPPSNMYV